MLLVFSARPADLTTQFLSQHLFDCKLLISYNNTHMNVNEILALFELEI